MRCWTFILAIHAAETHWLKQWLLDLLEVAAYVPPLAKEDMLPEMLHLQVAKRELKLECDYAYEARCQTRFQQLIADDPDFKHVMSVPAVVPELSSSSVLCTEWVPGVHIDKVMLTSFHVFTKGTLRCCSLLYLPFKAASSKEAWDTSVAFIQAIFSCTSCRASTCGQAWIREEWLECISYCIIHQHFCRNACPFSMGRSNRALLCLTLPAATRL